MVLMTDVRGRRVEVEVRSWVHGAAAERFFAETPRIVTQWQMGNWTVHWHHRTTYMPLLGSWYRSTVPMYSLECHGNTALLGYQQRQRRA